jgi:hypothetical protein
MVGSRLCLKKSTQLMNVCVRTPDLLRMPMNFDNGQIIPPVGDCVSALNIRY